MSILNYFKRHPKGTSSGSSEDKLQLPDPRGPLCARVPSSAIDAANKQVAKVLTAPVSRGPYFKLTPAQRFEVGKRALEHGIASSIRYFEKKYPDLPLKETTVRRLKNLYQSELQRKLKSGSTADGNDEIPVTEDIPTLPFKKTGRPLMIGEELDQQVQEYIRYFREPGIGAVVNTDVVIATGNRILMSKDANLLSSVTLTKAWAKYLLHRMNFVKRKATTKAKVNVEHFEEVKRQFLLEITNVVTLAEIPFDLVINFDQTGINYIPVSSWTMEVQGAKRVEVAGKDDKRQITAVFAGSMTGDFLPPQLVYQGKTERCLPHYQFPESWDITFSPNHWSNEHTMKRYVENIILPYIKDKKKALKLPDDYPSLLIFDNFKAQCTSDFLMLLDDNHIYVTLVPPNCTDRLQPLDLSVNKAAKEYLRGEFQAWYAKQISEQVQGISEKKPVDLRLTAVKSLGAKWLHSVYDYFKAKPEIIRNGYRESGITSCLDAL